MVTRGERREHDDDGAGRPPPRTVSGFCAQADQKGTVTAGPGRPKKEAEHGGPRTAFAVNYGRAGFPLAADYEAGPTGRRFRWLVPIESVDYATYVPMLVDGLRERPVPYGACAALALWDLLARDGSGGARVLAALPRSVFPLRRALDAGPRDWTTVVRALVTLQRLAAAGRDGLVARAMVPFYRQLLPPLHRYYRGRAAHVTASDGLRVHVTYNVSDLCAETLGRLEFAGGPCAYVNIKNVIPTYEGTVTAAGGACCSDDDDDDEDRGGRVTTTRMIAPTPSLCSGVNVVR